LIFYSLVLIAILLLFRSGRWYVWNVLIGIDQLGNALLGGDHDETISSRAHKNRHKWYWDALCYLLEKVDPNHCERVVELDEGDKYPINSEIENDQKK